MTEKKVKFSNIVTVKTFNKKEHALEVKEPLSYKMIKVVPGEESEAEHSRLKSIGDPGIAVSSNGKWIIFVLVIIFFIVLGFCLYLFSSK